MGTFLMKLCTLAALSFAPPLAAVLVWWACQQHAALSSLPPHIFLITFVSTGLTLAILLARSLAVQFKQALDRQQEAETRLHAMERALNAAGGGAATVVG
jgi:hypothetical protein